MLCGQARSRWSRSIWPRLIRSRCMLRCTVNPNQRHTTSTTAEPGRDAGQGHCPVSTQQCAEKRIVLEINVVPSVHMWLLQRASASGQDQSLQDHHHAWHCCSDSLELPVRQSLPGLMSAAVGTAESLPALLP